MKKFNSDYYSPMFSERRKRAGLVMLMAGFVFACSTALYLPKESTRISKEDLREMQKGRVAYINKCGSCHSLFLPEKYTPGQWKAQVERMATKAHLTSLEEEEILKYVTKNDSSLFGSHISPVERK